MGRSQLRLFEDNGETSNGEQVRGSLARQTGRPVCTVLPAVTGTTTSGQTLTCSTGTWVGNATITYTYQWYRTDTAISGATASTRVLAAGDVGHRMSCRVTARTTSDRSITTTVGSAKTAVVA